eukprot:359071-Chlamydomonas_euryale.AAC.9
MATQDGSLPSLFPALFLLRSLPPTRPASVTHPTSLTRPLAPPLPHLLGESRAAMDRAKQIKSLRAAPLSAGAATQPDATPGARTHTAPPSPASLRAAPPAAAAQSVLAP